MLKKLLHRIEPTLVKIYRRLSEPPTPNLKGDRDIEYSWVVSRMPNGSGEALDFGSGPGAMGLVAVRRGFTVTCLDLTSVNVHFDHPRLSFLQGNLLKIGLPAGRYDLVINCSSIEHVGLVGRYGITESKPDGDLDAMNELRRIMKRGGIMLLTVPVGRDAVFRPFHRVYGVDRLPRLLKAWEVLESEYWVKNGANRWEPTREDTALAQKPTDFCYGLGLFVLQRPLT